MNHTLQTNFRPVSQNEKTEEASLHVGFRVTPSEKLELIKRAGSKPLSAFIRDQIFGGSQRKRKTYRKPKYDDVLLSKVLAALGNSRLSSNINQIAKAANRGVLPVTDELSEDLQSACLDIQAMRMALMIALGFRSSSNQGE